MSSWSVTVALKQNSTNHHFVPNLTISQYLRIYWLGIQRQSIALRWRHNGHDGVSNHQPHHCLLNRLFGCNSKKTSKLRVTGLCAGNSPWTGEFPAQMASNAANVSIWWRHHGPKWCRYRSTMAFYRHWTTIIYLNILIGRCVICIDKIHHTLHLQILLTDKGTAMQKTFSQNDIIMIMSNEITFVRF